jgi:hypothetical protein
MMKDLMLYKYNFSLKSCEKTFRKGKKYKLLGKKDISCISNFFINMVFNIQLNQFLPKLAQNNDMKSNVLIRSTDVFNVNLKQRPISFLLILLTAHISLNVSGTPS